MTNTTISFCVPSVNLLYCVKAKKVSEILPIYNVVIEIVLDFMAPA